MKLDGKNALVTGAGRGIGRAIALALARDGAQIAVADLDGASAERVRVEAASLGRRAVAIRVDLTRRPEVEAMVGRAVSELGSVDILVNNAGWDKVAPFLESDEETWDKIIALNFKALLYTCRAAVPGMVERGGGRIVNIGSDAGRVGSSLESVYSGAKGGVIAFTKTIAREVARRGVTANTVCPGPTDTDMLREVTGGDEGAKVIEAMTRAVPMKRLRQPEDVAAAVAFLASDEAGFITGQTLSVSGGLTMA